MMAVSSRHRGFFIHVLFPSVSLVLRVSAQGGYKVKATNNTWKGGQHGESILLLTERGRLSEPIGV